MATGGRHKTPGSETEDFIIQDTAGSTGFMSGLAPHDQQRLWLCHVSACLGWTTPSRILYPVCFWLGWETVGPKGSSSHFVFQAHCSWSTYSPCWWEAVAGPACVPPFPWILFSLLWFLSQVWMFISGMKGPGLCRIPLSPGSKATRRGHCLPRQVAFKPLGNLDSLHIFKRMP